MPERPYPLLKRVAAWLFGGTVFGLVVALGIWTRTHLTVPLQTAATAGAPGSGKLALQAAIHPRATGLSSREAKESLDPDLEDEEVQHLAASPTAVLPRRSTSTEIKESHEDSALLATLERLERRVAAGIARAR